MSWNALVVQEQKQFVSMVLRMQKNVDNTSAHDNKCGTNKFNTLDTNTFYTIEFVKGRRSVERLLRCTFATFTRRELKNTRMLCVLNERVLSKCQYFKMLIVGHETLHLSAGQNTLLSSLQVLLEGTHKPYIYIGNNVRV